MKMTETDNAREIFITKMKQYGTNWVHYAPETITDLCFIKAKRIINIDIVGTQCIDEPVGEDINSIINYAIMRLITDLNTLDESVKPSDIIEYYDSIVVTSLELLSNKNADYGEAWKDMRYRTILDLIMGKIRRIREMEQSLDSFTENIRDNLFDIINYSIFLLRKI
jgi:hypothetical protein